MVSSKVKGASSSWCRPRGVTIHVTERVVGGRGRVVVELQLRACAAGDHPLAGYPQVHVKKPGRGGSVALEFSQTWRYV